MFKHNTRNCLKFTTYHIDEEVEILYDDIEKDLAAIPQKCKIINIIKDMTEAASGNFGLDGRNERGTQLLNILLQQKCPAYE